MNRFKVLQATSLLARVILAQPAFSRAPPTGLTGGPSLSDPRTFGMILGLKF